MEAATSVMLAQQYLLARLTEVLRPLGLTWARYEALVILDFSPDGTLPLARTSERLMMHPSSVTSTIDRLEEQGLVKREAHPSDRRVTVARITDAGSALARQAMKAVSEIDNGIPDDVSDEDIDRILESMAPLRRAAVNYQVSRRGSRNDAMR